MNLKLLSVIVLMLGTVNIMSAQRVFDVSEDPFAKSIYISKELLELGYTAEDLSRNYPALSPEVVSNLKSIEIVKQEIYNRKYDLGPQIKQLVESTPLILLSEIVNDDSSIKIYGKINPETQKSTNTLMVVQEQPIPHGSKMIIYIEGDVDLPAFYKNFR